MKSTLCSISFSAFLSAFISMMLCSAAALADQEATCDLTITGARTMTIKGKAMPLPPNATPEQALVAKRVTAGSDYWLSDSKIRENMVVLIQTMDFGTKKKTPQEVQQEADRRMKADDPRIMLLVMSCGDKGVGMILQPAAHSKYADVPFKPAHYTIIPQRDDGKPGQFRVIVNFKDGPKSESFRVSTPGTLDIEQFDSKGLAGKFAFKAENFRKDQQIDVAGVFRYSCSGDKCTK